MTRLLPLLLAVLLAIPLAPDWLIDGAQDADAELWPVLVAMSWHEASYQPGAIGDRGCSRGLLQHNQCGGLGSAYTADELHDPVFSLSAGATHIRLKLDEGYSLRQALQPWSTRDKVLRDMEGVERAVVKARNGRRNER